MEYCPPHPGPGGVLLEVRVHRGRADGALNVDGTRPSRLRFRSVTDMPVPAKELWETPALIEKTTRCSSNMLGYSDGSSLANRLFAIRKMTDPTNGTIPISSSQAMVLVVLRFLLCTNSRVRAQTSKTRYMTTANVNVRSYANGTAGFEFISTSPSHVDLGLPQSNSYVLFTSKHS